MDGTLGGILGDKVVHWVVQWHNGGGTLDGPMVHTSAFVL